jgi:hypothetical protein
MGQVRVSNYEEPGKALRMLHHSKFHPQIWTIELHLYRLVLSIQVYLHARVYRKIVRISYTYMR